MEWRTQTSTRSDEVKAIQDQLVLKPIAPMPVEVCVDEKLVVVV